MVKKTQTASNDMPGYRVTVSGQYVALGLQGLNSLKFFKNEQFDLPLISTYVVGRKFTQTQDPEGKKIKISVPDVRRGNSKLSVQHLMQRYYLPPRLREKYEDFLQLKLCNIMSIRDIEIDPHLARDVSKTPIMDMTESELITFHAMNDLSGILNEFETLADKKEAVQMELDQMKKEGRPSPASAVEAPSPAHETPGIPADDEQPEYDLLGD